MASGGTKRRHEEDWDVLDLTGDTPVYSNLGHSSRSGSFLKPGASATHRKPGKIVPEVDHTAFSTYISKDSSRSTHTMSSGRHSTQGATSMLPPANTANYCSTYTSLQSFGSYVSGGPKKLPSQVALSPPAKKARKGKVKDADGAEGSEKPEKRGAIMKKKCPQNILERVDRVMSQRCVDHSEVRW